MRTTYTKRISDAKTRDTKRALNFRVLIAARTLNMLYTYIHVLTGQELSEKERILFLKMQEKISCYRVRCSKYM